MENKNKVEIETRISWIRETGDKIDIAIRGDRVDLGNAHFLYPREMRAINRYMILNKQTIEDLK